MQITAKPASAIAESTVSGGELGLRLRLTVTRAADMESIVLCDIRDDIYFVDGDLDDDGGSSFLSVRAPQRLPTKFPPLIDGAPTLCLGHTIVFMSDSHLVIGSMPYAMDEYNVVDLRAVQHPHAAMMRYLEHYAPWPQKAGFLPLMKV